MSVTEELHDLLAAEVADEPPYLLDPDAVVAGGRRRRRSRTTVLAGGAGVTVVALAGVVLALQPASGVRDSVTTPSFGAPAVTPQGEIESIVRAHTPASWTVSEVHESASAGFQANVDDGEGASRLYVGVSPSPGSLQQHPCQDEEFSLGQSCKEVQLDADTRLVTRGPAASGPVTSSHVVIVHTDGSGVDVGNDNATFRWFDRMTVTTPEEKRALTAPSVNRDLPVYSLEQLVEIAKAVDAATSGR